MDVHQMVCWLLHRKWRELLVPGILPFGLDAVVFCWRCDKFRGRAVKVFRPNLGQV
jgi:hypothetical protein